MQNKKYIFSSRMLLIATICGSFALSSNTQAAKKKKKTTSTVTNACIACLNSFDPETLKFTMDEEKCTKRVAKCFKSNLTSQCEGVIQECIQYNCANSGSCADEAGNRNLFAGCLKAVDIVLPYQCASYIAGYASSKATEVQSIADAQANALEEKKLAAQQAASAAEKAKTEAELKAKQIAEEAETKRKQIEADNEIKLAQEKAKLEQQAKDAELARQKKEALEAKNNKPNVKYNNLLNAVKQDITTAKTYTNKAYNLLGITKTDKSTASNQGSAIFFAPQVVNISGIMAGTDAKTRSLVNASRYKADQNFVCTKNTKENIIRNELNNVYNTIKKSRDNLSTGIAEIEATNADDEAVGTISESKINTLYMAQNKLTEIMETIEGYTSQLKTSCETRCEGMSAMQNTSSISATPIQFDENGNIIEEKKKDDETYSCKDFENDTSSQTGFSSLFTGTSSSVSDMIGGIGKKVTELTKRNTLAVLETDKVLDEALIAAQSGKFDSSTTEYPAIDSCTQYMVLDIASYTNCASNVLGQQFTALSKNKENQQIIDELNSSISKIIKTLQSPNYEKKLEKTNLKCTKDGTSVSGTTYTNLYNYDDFYTCISSLTNALNEAKKDKTETGNSNFYITNISKEGNTSYIFIEGQGMTANDFAQKKLEWTSASNCSVDIAQRTTEYDRINNSTFTQTNIDIDNSTLYCDCGNTGRSACRIIDIKMGRCGKSACETK